jgi:acyl-CoA synthetase (AMP-forming)/AMP-acid ligase II
VGLGSLLDAVECAPQERGIRSALSDGSWTFTSYADIAAAARLRACALADAGVGPGDAVCIAQRGGPDFLTTLLGALLAGATPAPLAPPVLFRDPAAYARELRSAIALASPRVVVADDALRTAVEPAAAAASVAVAAPAELVADRTRIPARRPSDESVALLQFTSGSSGTARGVRLSRGALEWNIGAIRTWLEMTADDATATWLPVHHDMGLIGCLLTPFVNGSDVYLMQPEDFVRDPLRWLRCFAVEGASLGAVPAFALAHVVRRVPADALAGLDFSNWRALIVGAERLQPAALTRFEELLAPAGFRSTTLCPAYGLAEATLAVTGLPLGESWRAAAAGQREPPVASSGRPLPGVEVQVLGVAGEALGEGEVGELAVRSPGLAAGYVGGDDSASLTQLTNGVLYAGDAGFVLGGELFVLGRLGDGLKLRGITVLAEDVEATLEAGGFPPRRLAVAFGYRGDAPTALVVLEGAAPDSAERAAALVRGRVPDVETVVAVVAKGSIPRTTSGKTKRRELWERSTPRLMLPLRPARPRAT